jgi:hypothetical protein
VSGVELEPQHPHVLALSLQPAGGGVREPLAAFTRNAARAAIINALGPVRQIVRGEADVQRRHLSSRREP